MNVAPAPSVAGGQRPDCPQHLQLAFLGQRIAAFRFARGRAAAEHLVRGGAACRRSADHRKRRGSRRRFPGCRRPPPQSARTTRRTTGAAVPRGGLRRRPRGVCASTRPGTTAPPLAIDHDGPGDPARPPAPAGFRARWKTMHPSWEAMLRVRPAGHQAWARPMRGAGPAHVRTSEVLWMRKSASTRRESIVARLVNLEFRIGIRATNSKFQIPNS